MFRFLERKDCADVKCPEPKPNECPPDSFKPTAPIPVGKCCPIIEKCQCSPGICVPASSSLCDEGEEYSLMKRGDGTPGNCCDEFLCVNKSSSTQADLMLAMQNECEDNGVSRQIGERWVKDRGCIECECGKNGVAFCKQLNCPPISKCSRLVIPDDECCPICSGRLDYRCTRERFGMGPAF